MTTKLSNHRGLSDRRAEIHDFGLVGTGLVVFISGFLPWYGASFFGFSVSASGWQSGFLAWFPLVLCTAVTVVAAARAFGNVQLPAVSAFGPALLLLTVTGLATLLILLRWLTLPGASGLETGPRAGLFLGLIAAAGQTTFAALSFRASDEELPWQARR